LKNNLKIGLKWGVWGGKDTLVCPSTTHQEKVMTGFLNWSGFGGLSGLSAHWFTPEKQYFGNNFV
jgi:hypothetical protein